MRDSVDSGDLTPRTRDVLKLISIPVIGASLCCLSPLLIFFLGLSSLSFAAGLSDILYIEYAWLFQLSGLALLGLSLFFYFRRRGICTLSAARRNRARILNMVLISVVGALLGYLFFLHVVVHYLGVWVGMWP
uniref:Mercuric transport protein MerT n=1 Tax=Candidatus Kentrum sp. MB TaxID=2138164 RepID=A0A450XP93_9GAMM|nr:MAG: hypothetical protein BECKMB1821G_GA0114241_10787 [Candidatus Kentron sp. MB]VFK34637.1 MAG: hypothetical protein BECKMB1821I_GA0114274_10787 [Candidatus Kentron sp. MB]VFK76837.1 MAG: hypothetical protein BECKMB1821H_GA0114242_10787 [Candidatus Kentron sp. MB]